MTTPTNKIIPHLWFNTEANEAAHYYCSIFPDSRIIHLTTLHNTPSGDCDVVSFELSGQSFLAISAGPLFKFNQSVSFILNFDPSRDKNAREHLDATWEKLSQGGTVLMPLEEYSFSKRYGWIQDKFGLSWQLILSNPGGEERPFIIPSLMFTGSVAGRSEEASDYYLSIFSGNTAPGSDRNNARRGRIFRYPAGMEPDKEGTIMHTDFMIGNQWFAAMDSAREHNFAFNEAVSILILCDTQEEIDYFWQKLSAVPAAEQCGWLKDKYGLSWQVSSTLMEEMMENGTRAQIDRLTQAFMPMKKIQIAELLHAYEGTEIRQTQPTGA